MSVQVVKMRPAKKGAVAIADAMMQASTGTFVVLSGSHVACLKTVPGYTPGLDTPDVEESTFPDYARLPVGTMTLEYTAGGRVEIVMPSVHFHSATAEPPESVVALAIYSALTDGDLLFIGYFPTPVPVDRPDSGFTVVPVIAIPSAEASDWGESAIIR